jgi:hypothetical protein
MDQVLADNLADPDVTLSQEADEAEETGEPVQIATTMSDQGQAAMAQAEAGIELQEETDIESQEETDTVAEADAKVGDTFYTAEQDSLLSHTEPSTDRDGRLDIVAHDVMPITTHVVPELLLGDEFALSFVPSVGSGRPSFAPHHVEASTPVESPVRQQETEDSDETDEEAGDETVDVWATDASLMPSELKGVPLDISASAGDGCALVDVDESNGYIDGTLTRPL